MSWKLSRTVLRGAVGGNADCLLDSKVSQPLKQPYAFELANGNLLGFAGLWDAWKDQQGHWLQSFAIVTTEANELMARIHTRMPVILHHRDYDRWLDSKEGFRKLIEIRRPGWPFWSSETPLAPLIAPLSNPRPLSTRPLPLPSGRLAARSADEDPELLTDYLLSSYIGWHESFILNRDASKIKKMAQFLLKQLSR